MNDVILLLQLGDWTVLALAWLNDVVLLLQLGDWTVLAEGLRLKVAPLHVLCLVSHSNFHMIAEPQRQLPVCASLESG